MNDAAFEGIPIARNAVEVVLPDGASSYHVTFAEAEELLKSKQAKRLSTGQIQREQDFNIRGTWSVRQSGVCGPLVLQMNT